MNLAAQIRAAKLAGGHRLNLSCGLTKFPDAIFELADTLEILDLSGNNLSVLPDDLWRLDKLRILFCSDNQFVQLPVVLGKCPQLSMAGFKANKINDVPAAALGKSLRWLILTDNRIDELPTEIRQCSQLQKLMLSGNQLTSLPSSMAACSQLELLRIAANRFAELPIWLLHLPRLSWLAYAGNPCSEACEKQALHENPITDIDWNTLDILHKLGEGASGFIHQAKWRKTPEKILDVALKLFKGNMTSDGLPHSEKTACISAGSHPNLIDVYGKITCHPAAEKGLLMALIKPDFSNIAQPPSLDSCTRDIYSNETQFALETALRIASGIASVALQLHSKGIMHGDLYAHNILHNDMGDCLLGDFGAASFYSLHDIEHAEALQRIEVRAFGCLLQELIARCTDLDDYANMQQALNNLQADCLQHSSAQRPLFKDILEILTRQLDSMARTPNQAITMPGNT
jgi:hypothetical protein